MRIRRETTGLLLILAACDPGEVVLVASQAGGTGSHADSIRAIVDSPYTSIAALGWSAGVPGAEVRLHLMSDLYEDKYWHVATADSTGTATFFGLLRGLYEVEVSRELSDSETLYVDSAVRLLAGGRRMYLPAPGKGEVTLSASHRGALVFSEFGLARPLPWDIPSDVYMDALYFEVYNNSDTTIHLDGKYWGIGWNLNRDYPYWPCAQTEPVRNDPAGIWTRVVLRFPGRGTDFPLEPGHTALIAKAAMDHRTVDPRLYDLSRADFEWGGRNTDNPDVPNLQNIGLAPLLWFWPFDQDPQFLSEPVDLATLPRYTDPYSGYVYVRIPRDLVLDASARAHDWSAESFQNATACLEDMHRGFERLPGPAGAPGDFYDGYSYQRRILMVLPDGRKVLQDTETSMADFVKAPRSPGWIP